MTKLTATQVDALRKAARSDDGRVLVASSPRATWAVRRGTVVALHHRGFMNAIERMDYRMEGRPRMTVKEGRITPEGLAVLVEHDRAEAGSALDGSSERDGH